MKEHFIIIKEYMGWLLRKIQKTMSNNERHRFCIFYLLYTGNEKIKKLRYVNLEWQEIHL